MKDLDHEKKLHQGSRIERQISVIIAPARALRIAQIDNAEREIISGESWEFLQRRLRGGLERSLQNRIGRHLAKLAKIRPAGSGAGKEEQGWQKMAHELSGKP